MSFLLDFDKDIWQNQRVKIRRLGAASVFYRLLKALTAPLIARGDDLQSLLDETTIVECPADRLWVWGERLKVYREDGESDAQYRLRLLEGKYIRYGTASEQIWLISQYSGIPSEDITWEKMPQQYYMGGTINGVLSDRQKCFLSRRFYIPAGSVIDMEYIKSKIEKYLKGGESLEIIERAA